MLPKIVVASDLERNLVLEKIGFSENKVLGFEGAEAKMSDLRHWTYTGVGAVAGDPTLSIVIWDADRMSPECQAVLLKPLEEVPETVKMFLVVESENGLLPTIVSRCVVEVIEGEKLKKESYWTEVLRCWSGGPSYCVALATKLEKEEMENALMEIIGKLKMGLEKEVNINRLATLDLAIICLNELRSTNVNAKLSFENFLFSSWRLISKRLVG